MRHGDETCRNRGLDARRAQWRSAGLTLIELLMATAIVGVLAAIAVPMYQSYRDKVELQLILKDMRGLETRIERFRIQSGELPDALSDLGEAAPTDPWGNPFVYLRIEGGSVNGKGKLRKDKNLVPINSDYDLYSMGPDGASVGPLTAAASRDDIIRASNGAYYGVAEEY